MSKFDRPLSPEELTSIREALTRGRPLDTEAAKRMAEKWEGMVIRAAESGEPMTRIRLSVTLDGRESVLREAFLMRHGDRFYLSEQDGGRTTLTEVTVRDADTLEADS